MKALNFIKRLFEEVSEMKNWNVEDVRGYEMEARAKDLEAYIVEDVYSALVAYARKNFKEFVSEERVFIPNKGIKDFKMNEGMKVKEVDIKKILMKAQLLETNDGGRGYIKTYKGKSIRGIALRIKK